MMCGKERCVGVRRECGQRSLDEAEEYMAVVESSRHDLRYEARRTNVQVGLSGERQRKHLPRHSPATR